MVLKSEQRLPTRPAAQGPGRPIERLRFAALGTQCEVQFCPDTNSDVKGFSAAAVAWVTEFEAKYSRFKPDSLVSRINTAAGRDWVALDGDAERMFALADQIHVLTRGILDVTMLPLLRLWNYKAEQPRVPVSEEVWAAAAKVGWSRVRREPGRIYLPEAGMGIDLGGFGKEYAVDRVAEIAHQHGIKNMLVDFGHDVRTSGAPGDGPCWTIGVEDPKRPGSIRSRLVLNDGAAATSGDYIRHFHAGGKRYGHIIDPRTGYPVSNGCDAVTVVAGTCLEAGLLSTTAFVLGPEEGLALIDEYFGAEGLIQCPDREMQTKGFYRYAV